MKTVIHILALLAGQAAFAQTQKASNFYLYYGISGLGSNFGKLEPTVIVRNNQFIYEKVQNSYWSKRNKKAEFINKGFFRQSSVDSILNLVKDLKDSTIFKTNPCIMSGAIVFITIAKGTDTTKYTLGNTFDTLTLKIKDILNAYLPKNEKLYGSVEDIKEEQACWNSLQERRKDSTTKQ